MLTRGKFVQWTVLHILRKTRQRETKSPLLSGTSTLPPWERRMGQEVILDAGQDQKKVCNDLMPDVKRLIGSRFELETFSVLD